MADHALVRRWLGQLGRLVSASMSPAEAADYLDAFTPMLAMRFDDGAFTPTSLEHIAAQCRYLPAYGELAPLLSAWRREQREYDRIAIEYAGPPAVESREPYPIQPAPVWCFDREPRLLGRRNREEIADLIQQPVRTPEEQIAILLDMAPIAAK